MGHKLILLSLTPKRSIVKKVTNCRICGGASFTRYLDLGKVPLCNNLTSDDKTKYPIEVLLCNDCFLSQLSVVVDPNVLYSNYLYHSSVSETFRKHCRELARTLKSIWVKPDRPEWLYKDIDWDKTVFPTVLDIACNDKCLLREFQEEGFGVLGVEPAENFNTTSIIQKKIEDGEELSHKDFIPVFKGFWSLDTAKELLGSNKRPWWNYSFVTAQNVLAHVDDVSGFVHGVEIVLDDNGGVCGRVSILTKLNQREPV